MGLSFEYSFILLRPTSYFQFAIIENSNSFEFCSQDSTEITTKNRTYTVLHTVKFVNFLTNNTQILKQMYAGSSNSPGTYACLT